jgi:membrane-associated phospholipid phosphatase
MRQLTSRTAIALVVGAVLTVVCYWWVDRPVARFVHDHRLLPAELWRWAPMIASYLNLVAGLAVLGVVLWRIRKPGGRLQTVLLAISLNLVLTTVLKQLLKWGFGRYWPENWETDIPTLIGSEAYGFHPFHYGDAYESFPSGHAAAICAILSILWLSYPRWRWRYVMVGAAVCSALVGMNYHFVGDVIAGGILGSLTGVWMTHVFRLNGPKSEADTITMAGDADQR